MGLRPSYVSFGPIFGTKSKTDVGFEAQMIPGVKVSGSETRKASRE